MKQKFEFSPLQNVAWVVMTVGSMLGIYGFLGTQTDVKDPFVIGVYFVVCAVVAWGSRRFIADNVDENGRYKPRNKQR
jgi:hypothetical protein